MVSLFELFINEKIMKIINKLKNFSIFKLVEDFSFRYGTKQYKKLNEDNPDLEYAYQFFFFGIFSQILWTGSGIIIALLLELWLEYIFVLIAFCTARRLEGGMHLNFHNHCYYTSIFFAVLFSYAAKLTTPIPYIVFLLSIGFILSIVWSVPKKVETSFDYTIEEETIFRKRYCKNAVVFYVLNIILLYLIWRYDFYILRQISTAISCGGLLASLMLMNWFEKLLKFVWGEK